jgi:cytochrome oxidase Cu insertion factor (SCO1/SenC/PrrC family)
MRQFFFYCRSALILAGGFFFACSNSDSPPGLNPGINNNNMSNKIEIGSKAPDFSLPDQRGNRVNLSAFNDKVLNIFCESILEASTLTHPI